MSVKARALCVGINLFRNYPDATLHGCVNDANDMSALLQKLLGFQSGDITVLHDSQATKANNIDNLKDLVAAYFSQTPQLECQATRRRSKIG